MISFRTNPLHKKNVMFSILLIACARQTFVNSQYLVKSGNALEGRVLTGHVFQNLTMKTVMECFLACIENCLCLSFQIYQETECQLLSSNQFQSKLDTLIGCTYYDMTPTPSKQITTSSCLPGCRINPCQNGGSFESVVATNYTSPHFKCICPPGYHGNLCQHVPKSCRGYQNGSRVPGLYKIFNESMSPFEVFCDFDTNSTMAWTMVQSYQLQHKSTFSGLMLNLSYPINETAPRWDLYRLSKPRMQSIHEDSSKFRITCNYDTDGVVYRDYLQVANDQINILTHTSGGRCTLVEHIDIQGQSCKYCTASIVQGGKLKLSLHFDSYYAQRSKCEFKPNGSEYCSGRGEDNFGEYNCVNKDHRCSASQSSTTQIWFG